MERYGIRGIALSWFKSYLTARTLKSKVNTNDSIMYSKPYDIEYGTPQGSCLGPLLFLLFTNDLHLHLLYSNCILFADDTTIFYSGKSIRYIEWCIQEDLKILQDWFQANKLTLNLNKTVVMIIGTKIPKNYKIEIDNHTLPVVTATKFLGIWIDSELNWKVHYDKLVVKLLQNMHMLRLCKNQFNMFTKCNIYFAHIYSHLSYGCTKWGNMLNRQQLAKLQKLQNKCLSYILNKNINYNDYQSLKLLRVKEIITLHNLKLSHKIQHKDLPAKLLQCCETDANNKNLKKTHGYNTRNKKELNPPITKNKWYKDSYLTKSINDFHNLPLEVKSVKSMACLSPHAKITY